MPVRGFLVVLAVALVATAGWFFYTRRGTIDLNQATVSRDITVSGAAEAQAEKPLTRFDIVRIDRSGRAVISGHAPPGSEVKLLSGEKAIGEVGANDRGEWVVVAAKPLKGLSQIAISVRGPQGVETVSGETAIAYVPRNEGTPLAIVERPDRASRILQRPDELGDAALTLALVDYIGVRGVLISGRAAPGSAVRIYIDNEPSGIARAAGQGEWSLRLDGIAPGAYTMRVDELGPKGAVTARIEVPFERAQPDLVADRMLESKPLALERGPTQWRVARRAGTAWRLTVIYPASRGQVRDANLIYPGQIFEQPEASPKP